MTKQELVEKFWGTYRMLEGPRSRRAPISRTQAGAIVDTVLDTVRETLEGGEDIVIPRFGKFFVKQHPEGSMVMDIKSKAKIPRPPDRMKTVRFKPSRQLVERVNAAVTTAS